MIRGRRNWQCPAGPGFGVLPWSDLSSSTPTGSGVGGGGANGPGAPPDTGNLLTLEYNGIVATGGSLYVLPHNFAQVLKITFTAGAASGIGGIGYPSNSEFPTFGFGGACRAGDGKVYARNHTTNKFLVIDPATDTFAVVASGWHAGTQSLTLQTGNIGWVFMEEPPSGPPVFYWVEFDLGTQTTNRTPITGMPAGVTGCAAILHPDGYLYLATDIGMVRVDLTTFAASYDYPFPVGMIGRMGLSADGTIVVAVSGQANTPTTRVFLYNPAWPVHPTLGIVWHEDISFVYDPGSSAAAVFTSVVLGPNGNLYLIPATHDRLVEVNVADRTYHIYDMGVSMAGSSWGAGAVGYDGRIYAAPVDQMGVLYVTTNTPVPSANWPINPYINHY